MFYRLLDLSSLDNKRVASTHSAVKVNGVGELKRPNKKVPKEDELSKFLARNSDDTEKTAESEEEKSDTEEITEEQFLKEQNEMLKEQLLQDSSESDGDFNDSDSDHRINGTSISKFNPLFLGKFTIKTVFDFIFVF